MSCQFVNNLITQIYMEDFKTVNDMGLVIPLKMKNILDYLAKKPLEWTAFGEVEEVNDEGGMYFILTDIAFPKQENAGATTEVSDDDYCEFGSDLHKAKRDTTKFKVWIHSHNSMKAFWSGTDTAQMQSFASPNTTHRLSLVVSSTDTWKACFNLYKPVRIDFDIPIIFNDNITDQEILDQYKTDLESKEKTKVYTTKTTHWGGLSSQYDDDYLSGYPSYKNDEKPKKKKKMTKKEKKIHKRIEEIKSYFTDLEDAQFDYLIDNEGLEIEEAVEVIVNGRGQQSLLTPYEND